MMARGSSIRSTILALLLVGSSTVATSANPPAALHHGATSSFSGTKRRPPRSSRGGRLDEDFSPFRLVSSPPDQLRSWISNRTSVTTPRITNTRTAHSINSTRCSFRSAMSAFKVSHSRAAFRSSDGTLICFHASGSPSRLTVAINTSVQTVSTPACSNMLLDGLRSSPGAPCGGPVSGSRQ